MSIGETHRRTPRPSPADRSESDMTAKNDTTTAPAPAPVNASTLYNQAKKAAFDRLRAENPDWTAEWERVFGEERAARGLTPRTRKTPEDKARAALAKLAESGVDVAALVASL